MRRRDFIKVIAGSAAAWPLEAQAQQPGRLRQIAVLMTYAEGDPDGQTRLTAFLNTFRDIGWIDGRNYEIIIRWAGGELERVRRFVRELVALAPDVMVVMSTPALVAAQKKQKPSR